MTKKILVVEDEEDILELISEEFGNLDGYRILCARDGEEALTMAREYSPDIIILDIQLPKRNGYEVCRLIKSDPATSTSDTRILMISGMSQNSDRYKALEAGADEYIVKPFSLVALVEKVEELLRSNREGQ